jgi:hypothetical protein
MMNFSRQAFTQAPDARANVCVALAAAAALLASLVLLLTVFLAVLQPGGSQDRVAVRFLYGPYVEVLAAALALSSIYCGLVRRYLVGFTEPRVRKGILVSLAVLVYLAFDFTLTLWE